MTIFCLHHIYRTQLLTSVKFKSFGLCVQIVILFNWTLTFQLNRQVLALQPIATPDCMHMFALPHWTLMCVPQRSSVCDESKPSLFGVAPFDRWSCLTIQRLCKTNAHSDDAVTIPCNNQANIYFSLTHDLTVRLLGQSAQLYDIWCVQTLSLSLSFECFYAKPSSNPFISNPR